MSTEYLKQIIEGKNEHVNAVCQAVHEICIVQNINPITLAYAMGRVDREEHKAKCRTPA